MRKIFTRLMLTMALLPCGFMSTMAQSNLIAGDSVLGLTLSSNVVDNTIYSGTPVTFIAIPSGSSARNFLWKKNGSVISGATDSTYTTSDLVNGDVIEVQLSANTGLTDTSKLVLNLDAGNLSSYSGSGTNWTDISGNNNNASLPTVLAASFSSTIGAGSFCFNGTSYTTIQSSAMNNWNITTSNAISVETWVKRTYSGNYQFWFSTPDLYYRLGVDPGGHLFWDMSHYVDRGSGTVVSEDVWHHVVYTAGIESGNITTRIYLDGVAVVSQDEGISSFSPFTNYLIGDGQTPGQHPLKGNMGLIRIYNKTLSAEEVLQNYKAEVDRFSTEVLISNSITMIVNPLPDPPTVLSVSSTATDGTYQLSDLIPITITFSDTVNVTGTPVLALNSGGSASYYSGNGSSTLVFNYTIGNGESTGDLDYSTTASLTLAGGSIKGAAGNDAILTLPPAGGDSSIGGQKNLVVAILPSLTTGEVSDIGPITATANANITDLGSPEPTAYGVCWNTTGLPTISDNIVDKGSPSATGSFTVSMTSLTANTTYYVRAFATNAAGTSYGPEVSFTTNSNPLPVIRFTSTSSSGAESESSASLQVSLSEVNAMDVTVDYSATGTASGNGIDYTLSSGTLTIPAGNTSENIIVASIVDDALVEGDETVIVTLSNPVNATLGTNTVHTYTIIDNDYTGNVPDNSKNKISVYPNPFADIIYIDNRNNDLSEIIVTGLSGQIALRIAYNGENYISLNHLESGTYFLTFTNKTGNNQVMKIIKK